MKKLAIYFSVIMFMALISNEASASPRPWYLKVRIGFLAKWSIAFGDCQPGWGLCLSLEDGSGQNYLGFDTENNSLAIRIAKYSAEAKNLLSGVLEIIEDSPVDPALIKQFPYFSKANKLVIIQKGKYKVQDDGDFYLIPIEYYLQ